MKKGFTLIELLVVIGIMAVIAAGVVALIDPLEKTRQANDANAQNAIGQVATAMQSSAAQTTDGTYPVAMAALVTTGELTALPVLPAGYTYNYTGAGTAAVVSVNLLSKKYVQGKCTGASTYWGFVTANGRACGFCGAVPGAATACAW